MIVTVDHVIAVRNILNEFHKLASCLLRQVILHELSPAESCFLHVRELAFRNLCIMDLVEKFDIFADTPADALRLSLKDLGERSRIQKLKYRTVAVADLDYVV